MTSIQKISIIVAFVISITASAQLQLVEPTETACKKIEEQLYISSLLNNSITEQGKYIDSVKQCMGESLDLFLVVGRYLYNNNEYNKSVLEFKKVIQSTYANKKQLGEAYYYLGLANFYINQYDESIDNSKKAVELEYETSWSYNALGLAYEGKKQIKDAIEYYKKALETNPKNHVAANNIGIMHLNLHNNREGLKYSVYADSLVRGSKPAYKSSIIKNLIQLQREDEAFILAEMAYNRFPNDKDAVENYSKVLFHQKRYDEILPLARKLIQLRPSNSYEWFSVAYIYSNAGIKDSAFYFYNLCLKYKPDEAAAYDNIGYIYSLFGMFEKAHQYVDKALSLDSNYHYFYSRKADIYQWQHDFENAYKWCLKFKQRFPERKGFDFNLGYCLQQLKRYPEAITHFKKALNEKPNDDRLLNNTGRCFAELGQRDSAMLYFQNALRINPENSYIYHNRAALYYDMKKYDLACADLQEAIKKEYNWIIDEKLIKMKKKHCPTINTKLNVVIHEYKGNAMELSQRHSFIQLSDSVLEKYLNETIKENELSKIKPEETLTSSVYNAYNVYPNPTKKVFSIETTDKTADEATVKVFNSDGKLVLVDKLIDANKKTFTLKNTPPGVYVIIISNKDSVLSTKKLIVED
jgi:tetratricopeptide (TPR) repeat protein